MKNKIKGFAKGNFAMERPEITFSDTHLMIVAGEGELYQGSFMIRNEKDGDIRGLVYPSSFRVHFTNQGFEGNPVKLKFVYDTTGMKPGQTESGKFTVVCNGGEYVIRFTAFVEKPYLMSAFGKIQSVYDLKKAAMQDFTEAVRIFRMREFDEILKYGDDRIRNLYLNFRKWALDAQALEEFLVGIKQKERIFLTLERDHAAFSNLLDDYQDTIVIQKNTWGHTTVRFSTDGDFLQLGTTEITTEDFAGSTYQLPYRICTEKLHGGNNYAVIRIDTPYETVSFQVEVRQSSKKKHDFAVRAKMSEQGLYAYLNYIGGKITAEEWKKQALACVNGLHERYPDDLYYTLLLAHVYIQTGMEQEAAWILRSEEITRQKLVKKPEYLGYDLFLQALLRKEVSYTAKAAEEITRLFMKNLYCWPLLCMMVNLDEKFKDPAERIRVYERQFSNGANHVLMYADAYLCYRDHVILLRKLGAFEIQIMDFASKYGIISRELALYLADLVIRQKKYDKRFLRILERAYRLYEEPRILQAVCSQLIMGDRRDEKSFYWYDKAVRQELKIAQLYEYYMMSANEDKPGEAFPRIVYLYFLHGTQLDYRKKALLYASLLLHEQENDGITDLYMDDMKAFAKEQLRQRHITRSLCILYKRFIREPELMPEDYEALCDICYAYRIRTDRTDMKYVLVIEKDGSVRQRVSHKEEGAIVFLHDKEARVIWESRDGRHYTDSVPYDTIRLFYETGFMGFCRKYRAEKNHAKDQQPMAELTFDNLKRYGFSMFEEQEIFLYCSRYLREENAQADDFVTYVCFELFKRGLYDKMLIRYLCENYCGSGDDMKLVWQKAKEYGVRAGGLAERIITQMLFSETMFAEEEIFEDGYRENLYFRVRQAYFAVVSREYVLHDRQVGSRIFACMMEQVIQKEYLADICKIALLKYYADRTFTEAEGEILQDLLLDCCGNGYCFAFFTKYPTAWLRKVQLHDKVILAYQSRDPKSTVRLTYRVGNRSGEGLDYEMQVLLPMYENIYVRSFVLYEGECLKYQFSETTKDQETVSERMTCTPDPSHMTTGAYGRLNRLLSKETIDREEDVAEFARDREAAIRMFPIQ